jgi:hypothetical protein
MTKRVVQIGIVGVVGIFVLLQVLSLPLWWVQNNPAVVREPAWDSPRTHALVQRACYDCHSNQTVWPWYAHIAPVSWLVTLDTIRGRRHLNFSEWGTGGGEDGEEREGREGGEITEVIADGSMPPSNYLWLHPDAKLTPAERQQLIDGLMASLR